MTQKSLEILAEADAFCAKQASSWRMQKPSARRQRELRSMDLQASGTLTQSNFGAIALQLHANVRLHLRSSLKCIGSRERL